MKLHLTLHRTTSNDASQTTGGSTNPTRLLSMVALLSAASALVLPEGAGAQEFPNRPIQLIVPWGAGGGTDAVARILAQSMQQELDQPINVVNRTGGSGVVGHSAIANAAPDGYTIGIVTIEIDMMHWLGLTDLTYENFDFLAMINADPAGVMVSADSEFETMEQLMTAIREQPAGSMKATGTGQGGVWHVTLAGLMLDQGLAPDHVTWVPSEGSAPGITDMIAGGVDFAPAALVEGTAMIDAERVRPLATMSTERLERFPSVPTLKEAIDSDFTFSTWRTLAGPKGMPEEVKTRLVTALENAYNSESYRKFMADRGLGLSWAGPEETTKIVAENDAVIGETMKAGGLVPQ